MYSMIEYIREFLVFDLFEVIIVLSMPCVAMHYSEGMGRLTEGWVCGGIDWSSDG